jgi:hypothetical protein
MKNGTDVRLSNPKKRYSNLSIALFDMEKSISILDVSSLTRLPSHLTLSALLVLLLVKVIRLPELIDSRVMFGTTADFHSSAGDSHSLARRCVRLFAGDLKIPYSTLFGTRFRSTTIHSPLKL